MLSRNEKLSEYYAKESGILSEYLDYLNDSRETLPSTAYNYYMTLRTLAKFLIHRRNNMDCPPMEVLLPSVSASDMASITPEEWQAYLMHFQRKVEEKDSSLAVRISVIRGFYEWMAENSHSKPVAFILNEARPSSKSSRRFTNVSASLEETICKHLEGDFVERNTCIVRLIAHCGLGLQEICALDLEDIEVDNICVRDPSNKKRTVPLDKITNDAINAYLAVRTPPLDESNPFFVSATKGRMKRGAVQKMLRKATAAAGIKNVSQRDLQLTAKTRFVSEHGLANAAEYINVSTAYYYKKTFAQEPITAPVVAVSA